MHGDDLRIVYRHFPLNSIHDKAQITAEAAEAAGAQGAFWEMHDLLYERYMGWARLSADEMPDLLAGYAEDLGLDVDQFSSDLEDHTFEQKVNQQAESARAMGLPGTPSIIINGQMYLTNQWGLSFQGVDAFTRLALLTPRMYDSPPEQVIDTGRQYQATLHTDAGDIVIELDAAQAPLNVNSFVFLAQEGWYDGNMFFLVIPDMVAQAGDPTNTGAGYPGYGCGFEATDLGFDEPGIVAVAGGSQFFITMDAMPNLQGRYTVIGRVVEGMDIVRTLTPRNPMAEENPPPGSILESVEIEER